MRGLFALAVAALCFTAATALYSDEVTRRSGGIFCKVLPVPQDDVVIVTPETFKEEVLNHDGVVLVEFFAPCETIACAPTSR